MIKLMDKLLMKIGVTRAKSPNLNAKTKEAQAINQRSIQMEGRQNYYVEGNIIVDKLPTWSEKKIAAENLIKAIDSFFFSAFGRNGRGGYLDPRNLEDGSIKKPCLPNVTREFTNAKEKLKKAICANASTLEKQDQMLLHALQDSLLSTPINKITENLKEETSSNIKSLLEKYFK